MKKLLFLFLLLFSFAGKAQYVFPTLQDKPVWHFAVNTFGGGTSAAESYIEKDTVINSLTYYKVRGGGLDCGVFYRIDGEKVYAMDTSLKERKLYDFALKVGDSVWIIPNKSRSGFGDSMLIRVASMSIPKTSDSFMKAINFDIFNKHDNKFVSSTLNWTKGAGASDHPFYSFLLSSGITETDYSLRCVDTNGSRIYPFIGPGPCRLVTSINKSFEEFRIEVFPNPFVNAFTLVYPDGKYKVEVSDVLGKRWYSAEVNNDRLTVNFNAPSGIYLLKVQQGNKQILQKLIKE